MEKTILFNSRDELLRMDVSKIVCFDADGNYTHIVSLNKLKATIGASLAKAEIPVQLIIHCPLIFFNTENTEGTENHL